MKFSSAVKVRMLRSITTVRNLLAPSISATSMIGSMVWKAATKGNTLQM